MDGNSKRWHFKHGLDPDFMKKLEAVSKAGGWFADVLADPDLILGIRNNYMNVYWHGCSLFKIEWNGKTNPLKFSTHPKYLIDPGLSKVVLFDGSAFDVGGHDASGYVSGRPSCTVMRSSLPKEKPTRRSLDKLRDTSS